MANEPATKRAVAFVDGQNLYHAVKRAFGYTYPNYDVSRLAAEVCTSRQWELREVRFYTGVPDARDNAAWAAFWSSKLAAMRGQGVVCYARALRYQTERVPLPDGSVQTRRVGHEKGIDIRIALDAIRLAIRREYDVALLFSQDQDLSEVADEVRDIAAEQDLWIRIASAFPVGTSKRYTIGVDRTDWLPFDQTTYDACIDPTDYRPRRGGGDP